MGRVQPVLLQGQPVLLQGQPILLASALLCRIPGSKGHPLGAGATTAQWVARLVGPPAKVVKDDLLWILNFKATGITIFRTENTPQTHRRRRRRRRGLGPIPVAA